MAEEDIRRRDSGDIVLAPNEWLLVRDRTKGDVNVHVGPCKTTISETDRPVIFDERTKKFVDTEVSKAIQLHPTAPEGYYIVLKNPAYNDKGEQKHPAGQGKASPADLSIGRKVNIPGPISFPLFPGQMAKTIKGHNLRSNQYLLVKVYDDEAARKNWKSAIIKPQTDGGESGTPTAEVPELTMGKLLVIKGTDVAFYIPPTGIEVCADPEGKLIRDAVTLERLEYCLLRDENGNKRYERGPAVVFPRPTEVFADREIEKDGKQTKTRKFRAIELNENSGIYIKVIADYKDESGSEYKQGNELFITGKDQMIYFPREEHAIVKYDNNEIHYGIAIPAGEARYVLDRNKGDITLIKGPQIFLPDPRTQVIVRRLLDYKTCNMLYPGNQAALNHNASLAGVDLNEYMTNSTAIAEAQMAALLAAPGAAAAGYAGSVGLAATPGYAGFMGNAAMPGVYTNVVSDQAQARGLGGRAARGFSGDTFVRQSSFTEPRTITLSTKFDGAVSSDIWPNYAMMLVSKSGKRRVVQGPQTVLLEYDEQPQILALSRGKPKTTNNLLRTAFLLTTGNKVSDLVEVETSDFCKLKVKVSYRVNFEGDPEKWFSVENYTKFMTDHLRSKLRSATKKIGVERFYGSAEDFVRDTVLGTSSSIIDADGKVKTEGRPGTVFEENGMHVYDVEVLGVDLDNREIAQDLSNSQKEVIKHALTLATAKRALEFTKESEAIKQETAAATTETLRKQMELKQIELTSKLQLDLATLEANSKTLEQKAQLELDVEQAKVEIEKVSLAQQKAKTEQEIALEAQKLEQKKDWLRAEAQAFIDQHKALDPNLAAALNAFGERALIEKAAEALAPLSMVKGSGVMDLLGEFLKNTPFAKHLIEAGKNGTTKAAQPRA